MSPDHQPRAEHRYSEPETTRGGTVMRSSGETALTPTANLKNDPALRIITDPWHVDLEGMFSRPIDTKEPPA